MEDDNAVIYGLEFQTRTLTPQVAETDAIRFLVGTQSLRLENQVHLVDFDDDNNTICKNIYLHKEGEIWHMSCSHNDPAMLATCYNSTTDCKAEAAVWKLPADFDSAMSDDDPSSARCLQLLTRLSTPQVTNTKRVMWHPSAEGDSDVITLSDSSIVLWDLNHSGTNASISSSTALESRGQPKLTSGRWNPHQNCTQIATANGTNIRGWDLRSMKQVYHIENAHSQLVREVDFNPNKQYHIASCGDDCKVKIWDVRNTTQHLKVITDHSHWVWSVRFNSFHDQLVLTSSSDSRVILSNTVSISSEPFGQLADDGEKDSDGEEEERKEPQQDGIINIYEEHEDSVYAAEWSTTDPWIFASLSYDGRLVINRVPRATKYQILL